MIQKHIILTLSAGFLAFSFTVNAQEKSIQSADLKYMHHEVLDDPYLPNAYGNKLTAPGYRYDSRLKSGTGQSSIFTAQVNVDEFGDNILGDAANEPSIAVNPWHPEVIAIGWRQFDNVASNFRQAGWGYSTDGGRTWTYPGVIEPGFFRSDPVLDYDAEGNFFYNSLTNDPDYYCTVFKSNNGGMDWDEGVPAHGGDKQWMAIDRTYGDGHGNVYASWTSYYSTCEPGFFTRSTDAGKHFENCIEVPGNPYWATMAVGNEGELYIAGNNGVQDSIVVVRSLNVYQKDSVVMWDDPVMVYMGGIPTGWQPVNPAGLMGQVNVDVDRSDGPGRDNVYVLASIKRSMDKDPGDVMFTRSTDGGATWSAPLKLNDDISTDNYQWFGTMAVAPDGRIDAVWLDTRDATGGSDSSALYYSYSIDEGLNWSENEKLSPLFDPHVGYPNQNKMGDYIDMVSDSAGVHLAWANTMNGEQDVYYSRIIPNINSTAIKEISDFSNIRIYPNPVTAKLHIRGLGTASRIEILNITGQKIFSGVFEADRAEIDLSGQSSGIYIIRVIDMDGGLIFRKIAKQ